MDSALNGTSPLADDATVDLEKEFEASKVQEVADPLVSRYEDPGYKQYFNDSYAIIMRYENDEITSTQAARALEARLQEYEFKIPLRGQVQGQEWAMKNPLVRDIFLGDAERHERWVSGLIDDQVQCEVERHELVCRVCVEGIHQAREPGRGHRIEARGELLSLLARRIRRDRHGDDTHLPSVVEADHEHQLRRVVVPLPGIRNRSPFADNCATCRQERQRDGQHPTTPRDPVSTRHAGVYRLRRAAIVSARSDALRAACGASAPLLVKHSDLQQGGAGPAPRMHPPAGATLGFSRTGH